MTRKAFVKNTTDLIDRMVRDDETVRAEVIGFPTAGTSLAAITTTGPAAEAVLKRWKKDIDALLKDLYNSIRDNRILQRPVSSGGGEGAKQQGGTDSPRAQSVNTEGGGSFFSSFSGGKNAHGAVGGEDTSLGGAMLRREDSTGSGLGPVGGLVGAIASGSSGSSGGGALFGWGRSRDKSATGTVGSSLSSILGEGNG
ncbi:hypothetical protein HK102_010034, partial [Quaeritorhiza haematococci]